MHSISDLTTFARKTKGQVPPQLVGASTTVVGNKMYLFGGRLVSLRRMVADLYVFDLETFIWEKLPDGDDVPGARYFHSTDVWDDRLLVVFGGMGYAKHQPQPAITTGSEELCVLNDVRFFDLKERRWIPKAPTQQSQPSLIPRARYAHLSSVTSDRLFIIGGQDMSNNWLDDIHVYDLRARAWVQRRDYPRHCGTYRSVAVSGRLCVRIPDEEQQTDLLGPPGTRFKVDYTAPPPSPNRTITDSDALIHLPYSAKPTAEYSCDILLYSNYNFTDVRRELEVITPSPGTFTMVDRSDTMSGTSLPPGLRFPTGAILGTHLLVSGTYLAHSYQSFSIWALNLLTLTWSRIDAGATLSTGSWSRGVLWPASNKFLIFGNRNGNLVEDYNRRLLSWEHVAYIDLEAFGIYQPPPRVLEPRVAEMGLAALEEGVCADFEVISEDGRKVRCSRRCLEERWPWFREQMSRFQRRAKKAAEALHGPTDIPLPDRDRGKGVKKQKRPFTADSNGTVETAFHSSKSHTRSSSFSSSNNPLSPVQPDRDDDDDQSESDSTAVSFASPPDPRLTPRTLHLSEPYAVTLALLQYIYSLSLITPLQHAPPVLSSLLLLATNYGANGGMQHLEGLARHAMHLSLSKGPGSSVGIYEVATVCDCQSLQIRALKVVMSSSRRTQQPSVHNNAPPSTHPGGGGGPSNHQGAPDRRLGGGAGGYTSDHGHGTTNGTNGFSSRPRGTSNANALGHQHQLHRISSAQGSMNAHLQHQQASPTSSAATIRPAAAGGFGMTKLTLDTMSGPFLDTVRKLSLPETRNPPPSATSATASLATSATATVTATRSFYVSNPDSRMASAVEPHPPVVIVGSSTNQQSLSVDGLAGPRRRERAATVSEMGGPGTSNSSNGQMGIKREDSELLGNYSQLPPPGDFGDIDRRGRLMHGRGQSTDTEGESGTELEAAFPPPPTSLPLSPSGSGPMMAQQQQQQQLPLPRHSQMGVPSSPSRSSSFARGSTGSLRNAANNLQLQAQSLRHKTSGDTLTYSTNSHRTSSFYASTAGSVQAAPPTPTSSTYLASSSTVGGRRRTVGSDMTAVRDMMLPTTPPPGNTMNLDNVQAGLMRSLGPIEETSPSGGGGMDTNMKRHLMMKAAGLLGDETEGGETTLIDIPNEMLVPSTPTSALHHQKRPSSASTGDNSSSQPTIIMGYEGPIPTHGSSGDSGGTPTSQQHASDLNLRSPVNSKYDKELEKARKKLEKLEKKAKERSEKDEKERWEKEEKRRKKLLEKPDPQILADRMRYMGVMSFAR